MKIKTLFISLLFVTIIVFAIGNPSPKQFKDYIGEQKFEDYSVTFQRTKNYIFYSKYEFNYTITFPDWQRDRLIKPGLDKLKGEYIGFFFNFYKKQ